MYHKYHDSLESGENTEEPLHDWSNVPNDQEPENPGDTKNRQENNGGMYESAAI